jgi:2-polyprenyl-6-methoxyphenol hydroxylase-like FAD-dependent oxidoreductase
VTSFAQDGTGDVARSDGQSLRAEYLVGCDGGRSLIGRAAGIEFPGWDPTTTWLIAEVEMAEGPKWGFREDALGIHALSRLENGGPVRVVLTERQIGSGSEPTLRDLSEALIADYGTDYGIHSPTWISRCTDMTRRRGLPRAARPAGRRRRARASPGRWTGPQHRCAGRGESGMEAGPSGQADIAGRPSSISTTPSVTRLLRACCATRWGSSLSAAPTTAPRS